VSVTPKEERDARVKFAMMDHSSIRVLGNAFPSFFAGLPLSSCGDHPHGCSLKRSRCGPQLVARRLHV
jgi:hypothetical protein